MKKVFTTILCIAVSAAALLIVLYFSKKTETGYQKLKIGSSEYIDLIYPTASILSTIINTDCHFHDLHTEVKITSGSDDSLLKLLRGDINMALVDDIVSETAYEGKMVFAKSPKHTELRSICAFYLDAIVFIVNDKSNINSFNDIRGKKISISLSGNSEKTGEIANEILDFYKLKSSEFEMFSYGFEESIMAMENGEIDGFMYLIAMPNSSLTGISHSKKIKCRLISLDEDLIHYLQRENKVLRPLTIPKSMYPDMTNKTDVITLGDRVMLVTLNETDNKIVYEITKAICEDFNMFKSVHPAFKDITPKSMAENLTLPVHPGALKYYKKADLAEYIPKDLILNQ